MRVAIDLSDAEVAWIDRAVTVGLFESRDAAIKSAISGTVGRGLDDAAIAEAYRRAYGEHPEDEAMGRVGLQFLADSVRAEREGR